MGEILVMDCEERETFWITLKGDHTIHFATTACEGLEMLTESIGIVFLNLRLPDMKGVEVLKLIKKEYPSAAVIIITSCGKEETCTEDFRKGERNCPSAPFDLDEILRRIQALKDEDNRQHVSLSTGSPREVHYPDIPSHLVEGILKVKDFIARNYAETLTLHEACKMASMSKTYFCHFFKRITGHSLRNYQHVVRIHVAEELLRDRKLSLVDTALQLGYSDSNYFSTIYKKITGSSPKHRRASEGKLENNKEELNRV